MPAWHIIEGPVGAGKTTYANQLGRELRTPPLVLDNWMTNLFQADRPEADLWTWYAERKARCFSQIMVLARNALDLGNDAIVELGLLKAKDRLDLYVSLENEGRDFLVHVLRAPRAERRRRVPRVCNADAWLDALNGGQVRRADASPSDARGLAKVR